MNDKTIRLFLIEDDKVDQMAFERFVRNGDLPYDYTIAGSIAEAKEILKTTSFDVIIADYMLGDGTSFELSDQFKYHPVIVITGTGNEEIAVEAMKLGAYDYLIKDPEGHYLKALPVTVELALKRKQTEKELLNYQKRLESMVKERTAQLEAEIVERKRTEEELHASEKKFRVLYNNSPDMYVSVSHDDASILICNETLLKKTGYSREEIIGFPIFKMYHDDCMDEVKKTFQQFAETGVIQDLELILKRKDGSKIDVSLNANAVRDEAGTILHSISSWRDITERKKLEAQLEQAQKMESIGTLAGGIAHDFNNILSPIMVYSEMTMMELPSDSPIQHNLKQIYKAGERARDLVGQILTFSRKREQKRTSIKLSPILKEVLKLVRASFPTTIEIRQTIEAESDIILADPTQIHQVILNLCTNAEHAMRENGGILAVSLTEKYLDPEATRQSTNLSSGPYLKLSMSDTGYGIDPKVMERIFDPYFTTKEIDEGTGMGLAVVHGIVKSYGGDITVESELGKGTTFHVLFPIIETDISPVEEHIVDIPKGTERILFVDDEKASVDAIQPMLESLGYKVEARTSSIEALELFRNKHNTFDLVITDMTMPNMTGDDLAKELKKNRPDIPVILCTGFSEKIDENKAKEMGISYVMKPIIMTKIAKTIRKVLDKK